MKLAATVLLLTCTATSIAQQAPPLTKQEAAFETKVAHLAPQTSISVIPFHGEEEFGNFVSSTDAGFTFFDVDRKSNVTFRYADVRKIKEGYGGYSVHHRHTDRTRGLIVVAVAIGVIGGLIAAVATAKN